MHVWLEDQKLSVRDGAPPGVPGEVEVRVLAAGICNTDIELSRGYYPFAGVPGHEFVGVVESGELRGQRVVGEINVVCHECEACRCGRSTHCERRTVLGIIGRNGAFADTLTLPAENLHVVPDHVDDEIAVFTEPLAAALEIQEQVEIGPGDRVLVVGDGKLGQLIARTLVVTKCELDVAGRHRAKLDLLETAGIRTIETAAVRECSYDITIDCTGSAEGFAFARAAVRPRGTLVMKSTYAGELRLNASSLVVDEITLVGSRCGPFTPALQLLAAGSVDPRPLIHARYPLRDALEAFDHAQRPGVLKVLLYAGEGKPSMSSSVSSTGVRVRATST